MIRRGLSNRPPALDPRVKTLHLLRHAKAEAAPPAHDPTDHARPLNRRGRKAAEAMAAYLAENGFTVDRVFCSTAVRARETYLPLQRVLGAVPVAYRDSLYLIDSDELFNFVKSLPDTAASVLLIGHNPTYHETAVRLIGRAPGQGEAWRKVEEKFPTGALCSISFDVTRWAEVKGRTGTLHAFICPKDLA
jgi:phosphohistidine phosphatase